MTRRALILALGAGACAIEAPQPIDFSGEDFVVSPSGEVSLNDDRVPSVTTCADGQLVERTTDGWACRNPPASSVDWNDVANIPAYLDDGVDDDTLAGLTCADNNTTQWSTTVGGWECAPRSAVRLQDLYTPMCGFNETGAQWYSGTIEVCDGTAFIPLQLEMSDQDSVDLLLQADGAGSGVDADSIDGLPGAAFLRATGGGTLTDPLTISGGMSGVTTTYSGTAVDVSGRLHVDTPGGGGWNSAGSIGGAQLWVYQRNDVGCDNCTVRCGLQGGAICVDGQLRDRWMNPTAQWQPLGCVGSAAGNSVDMRCVCIGAEP